VPWQLSFPCVTGAHNPNILCTCSEVPMVGNAMRISAVCTAVPRLAPFCVPEVKPLAETGLA
jgi:hypothetical protein